ncbi:hypothetical protein SIO92_002748 [Burkholderia cenocepacia]|uniref:hypothetical protein n=1 Tax=Burkholderia cenocepacia TaxID=95486 RepID=UPI001B975C36|nr:hypothetical protein [Burkholderia cenocepacia]ELW9528468.1 hypothetical protein [Burkholderia cenocepacia]MBR8430641.1 hypothetical protein [Burkholderia cenocepacia]MDF0504364.1 hypothetical protein [Burkholderia cenocepacia]
MHKHLSLALNKYPVIPNSLRENPTINSPASSISVDLANLYHHYYIDSFGRRPPNPDPALFEHMQFLLPFRDFCFQGSGLGISSAIKKHRSNELGQAFCRWFLHDHFGITYFAHMQHVLDRQLHRAFQGCSIQRVAKGDTPDYFCARGVGRVFLAEAKGRYSSVSFKNREFQDWRKQFDRVSFRDANGLESSIKGHIVAARFATEENHGRVRSGLWAEDPASPGDVEADAEKLFELSVAIIGLHYSGISTKLGQPLLASSLASGVPLPDEIRVRCVVWKVLFGPLQGKRFVGGYFGTRQLKEGMHDVQPSFADDLRGNILRLDRESATFFGVEESIFRQVVTVARLGAGVGVQLNQFEGITPFFSGFSALRDGSVLGSIEWFQPDEIISI